VPDRGPRTCAPRCRTRTTHHADRRQTTTDPPGDGKARQHFTALAYGSPPQKAGVTSTLRGHSYIDDAGGIGKYRGGAGAFVTIEALIDVEIIWGGGGWGEAG
jgi:hypothetical protein